MLLDAMGEDPNGYPVLMQEGTIKDQFGVIADSSLLQSKGWHPDVELQDGLSRMAKWAKTSRFSPTFRDV